MSPSIFVSDSLPWVVQCASGLVLLTCIVPAVVFLFFLRPHPHLSSAVEINANSDAELDPVTCAYRCRGFSSTTFTPDIVVTCRTSKLYGAFSQNPIPRRFLEWSAVDVLLYFFLLSSVVVLYTCFFSLCRTIGCCGSPRVLLSKFI